VASPQQGDRTQRSIHLMAGCGGDLSEPEQAPASESISVDAQLPEEDVTQQAICPLKWYGDTTRRYYTTADLCAAPGMCSRAGSALRGQGLGLSPR
jgi:hypothetical protein